MHYEDLLANMRYCGWCDRWVLPDEHDCPYKRVPPLAWWEHVLVGVALLLCVAVLGLAAYGVWLLAH